MRVAITGMGAVSCLGLDLDSISTSLRCGRSGIEVDPVRAQLGFRSPLTGVIRGYDPRNYVSRKQLRSMAQPAQFAVGATFDAIQDAGLDPDALRAPGVGLIVGNDSCAEPSAEVAESVKQSGETRHLGSGRIIQVMTSTASMNLATLLGVQGACWTVSGACASGAHALGQAFLLIRGGLQDTVICGGAQEVSWQSMASFDALGTFAKADDPTRASRPFDRGRNGLVPSGGAAMLVLERLDQALQRGARVYAELVGYAFSCDGGHLTQPDGVGAARVMREVLRQAERSPGEVEYINAHATSTPVGDLVEGRSLIDVFGRPTPPVSSTKSMTGHECWMAGASEVVYASLMMRDGFLAPNVNLDELEPELSGLDVVAAARERRPRLVLSCSFGFGGTNAALLLEAPGG
jgi:3-oxoacyl-[acyl-carrier-protein] synthase-1